MLTLIIKCKFLSFVKFSYDEQKCMYTMKQHLPPIYTFWADYLFKNNVLWVINEVLGQSISFYVVVEVNLLKSFKTVITGSIQLYFTKHRGS